MTAVEQVLAGLQPAVVTQADWGTVRPLIWCYLTDRPAPLELVGSARAVVFRGSDVLVVRNVREEHFIPGGRRERGESVEDTVRREVLEETGWRIGALHPFALMHLYFDNDPPAGHQFPHPDVLWPIHWAEAERHDPEGRVEDGFDLEAQFVSIGAVSQKPLTPLYRCLLDGALSARKWVATS